MWTYLPATVGLAGLLASSAGALTITTRSRAVAPGEIVIVTIASNAVLPKPNVRVFERDLAPFAVDERTWRVLVGIDIDAGTGKHVLTVEAGAERATHTLVVAPKTFPTRRLTVDEAFVNPPEAARARIEEESKLVAAIWNASPPDRLWDGPFIRPVPHPANSAFGTRSIFNGQRRSAHGGADFLSPAGTPVKAPNAGKVVLVRNLYYSGTTVIIDHGLGVLSYFAHLSEPTVAEGDTVAAGVVVGKVGATGRVTGPHLHWTLRVSGARVDPLALLTLLGAPARGETRR
ncbi:MAG TPA: peptidoglycan DD-metalloendopeptidase family protein [Vicinamibacterales bacterium]|nr:peptidoglycan DD-metalloendopeptidase family protein [Vicinamibacterales bacterium]